MVDEIWLISLSHVKPDLPGYPRVKNDLREHMGNVLKQEALARGLMEHGEEKHQKFFDRFDRIELDVSSPLQDLGNLITGTLNFSQERTAALIAHGEYVVRLKFSPLKQPEYKFETGIGGFWKAIPACSLRNPFKRADISNPSQGEFELPKIYVKPDEAARPSWLASVMFLWIIYKDYSITDGWRRYLWATLISLVVLSIPTWWARLRRNFDIR